MIFCVYRLKDDNVNDKDDDDGDDYVDDMRMDKKQPQKNLHTDKNYK